MPQANNPTPDTSDPDMQEALAAYQAYKADQAQRAQNIAHPTPDAADKAASAKAPQAVSLMRGGAAHQDISDLPDMPSGVKNGFAKVLGGVGAGALGGAEAQGLGLMGRAAVNAGSAGLTKYLSNLIDQKQDRTEDVPGNMAAGGLISGGVDTVGAGAKKLADWLQQAATGMTKYTPGVGNNLVNQGIYGTKSSMAGQVARALPNKEQEVQDAVSSIKPNFDAQPLGDAIARLGSRFTLPSTGEVAPGMTGYADKVRNAADEFQSLGEGGELTPQDMLVAKRQGDWLGYTNSGSPATSLESEIGRAQSDTARGLLSGASDGETARKLADEQALILAKKALTKPDAIPNGLGSKAIFMKVPGQSLFGSVMARSLQKDVAEPAQAITNPQVLQSLFGAKNAAGGP